MKAPRSGRGWKSIIDMVRVGNRVSRNMTCWVVGVGCCMWQLSSLAAAELAPAEDLYILSVGTEGQVKSQGETDWYGKDAEFVRQSLNTAAPIYKTTHTRTLTADLASREAILEGLNWLATEVGPEDIAIVFFSVHGNVQKENQFLIYASGYWDAQGQAVEEAELKHTVRGIEINTALSRVQGRTIVWVDTCCAGGLLDCSARTIARCSYQVACRASEESSGQEDRPLVPHGYFVVALCEALSGMADTNHDGVVQLGEVESYLPARSKAFRRAQNVEGITRPEMARIALTHFDTNRPPIALYELPAPRTDGAPNPFNIPGAVNPDGDDVLAFVKTISLPEVDLDPNHEAWNDAMISGPPGTLEGLWAVRWNQGDQKRWYPGEAEIRLTENRVYILCKEEYLMDFRRTGDTLSGRYVSLSDPEDSGPIGGRIVGHDRIDCQWSHGRWDFRRSIHPLNP